MPPYTAADQLNGGDATARTLKTGRQTENGGEEGEVRKIKSGRSNL